MKILLTTAALGAALTLGACGTTVTERAATGGLGGASLGRM